MNIKLKLFLLSVLISVSNLSFAVDNGTWTYEINSDGTSITLTGTTDYPPPNLIIPKIIDDYNVTIIGTSAFSDQSLISVSIPNTVVTIGERAFSDNRFTSLSIPESVITIKQSAFHNSYDGETRLKSLTLGSNVVSIGESAFSNGDLTELSIPASVIEIQAYAFQFQKLVSVLFLGDRPQINHQAFDSNYYIKAFTYCSGTEGWLGSALYPNGPIIPVLDCGEEDWFYTVNEGGTSATIVGCKSTCPRELTIPEFIADYSVSKIGDGAFEGESIESVTLPDSLTDIGRGSFAYTSELETFNFGISLLEIGYGAFTESGIGSIKIPDSVITLGDYLFQRADSLNDVTIGNSVERIPTGAFYDSGIKSIKLGDSVTYISDYAFAVTDDLEVIDFGNTVSNTGQYVFRNSGIKQIILPSSFEGLGYRSFFDIIATVYVLPGPLTSYLVNTAPNIFGSNVNLVYCETSIDTDSDSIVDCVDLDDDNDGVDDINDAFPLNSDETLDTDGDGIGNNTDPDDDNDGLADQFDDLPLNPSEQIDTDGDGIGNNSDIDDDGDGVIDTDDLYPLDSTKQSQKLLDIDGNDKVDALTDGLVILRYVFGLRGDVLIGGVVAGDATRKTAEEIEAYLASLMPSL